MQGIDHCGARRSLHANDADVGLDRLGRDGDARDKPAPSYGRHDGVDVGVLLQDLQTDGSLAAVHACIVLEGIDVEHARAVDVVDSQGEGLIVVLAQAHGACAEVAYTIGLGARRAQGHHYDALVNAQFMRCHRDGHAVIAGGDGSHAKLAIRWRQLGHGVQRATYLEALATLLALELEVVVVFVIIEVDGLLEGCHAHMATYPLARLPDVGGGEPSAHATSSPLTNFDRTTILVRRGLCHTRASIFQALRQASASASLSISSMTFWSSIAEVSVASTSMRSPI